MKRKSYVVMLITVLALTGCGKTQRNEKPVEDNVTSQMPNIDYSVTTQIEQEAPAQLEDNDNTAWLITLYIKIQVMCLLCQAVELWMEKSLQQ